MQDYNKESSISENILLHTLQSRFQNWWTTRKPHKLVLERRRIRGSNDVGAFLKLTNSYFLVGSEDAQKSCTIDSADLCSPPMINITLGGCRIIGCMCVGNKYGLLVPDTIYDTELQHISEKLPDSVEVKQLEERLSALGNVIACNDSLALIHPGLDRETEEIIENILQVEVFRHEVANNPLVGSYCILNNRGGLVHAEISNKDLEELSSLLELPLIAGTVNNGSTNLGSGLSANDMIAYTGTATTIKEIMHIRSVLSLN